MLASLAWYFEHSAESIADPHAIWRHYLDVEHWCDWSRLGVEWSRIDGPFEVGTKGTSKPPGSPALAFRLIAVEPDASFTSELKMPGARLRFDHLKSRAKEEVASPIESHWTGRSHSFTRVRCGRASSRVSPTVSIAWRPWPPLTTDTAVASASCNSGQSVIALVDAKYWPYMAEDTVDLVRRGYAAYESEGVEGILPFLDPAVEWRNPPDSPIAGVFHSHDGVREWQRLTNEVFAELQFWPKEIIEAPDGRVLAICHARARGRESDVVVEAPFAHVIEVRDGKAVAFQAYSQVADARAAVGLAG